MDVFRNFLVNNPPQNKDEIIELKKFLLNSYWRHFLDDYNVYEINKAKAALKIVEELYPQFS
tara:strand:- start:2418 stop:2603 length:186 start_codon:yes stop_codon:yes gene_type:complete